MSKKLITSVLKRIFCVENLSISRSTLGIEYPLVRSRTFQHAMNTPVTVARGNLEKLLESSVPSQLPGISSALQAIESIEKLVSSACCEIDTESKFEINSAVSEVLVLLKGYKGCSISCINTLCQSEKLHCDQIYFQEALLCLLKNAVESYPDEQQFKPVVIYLTTDQDYLRLEVSDFGRGLTQVAKRIAMYEGVSYKQSGNGLGLHLVRYVFESLLEGTFSLFSNPGIGTRAIAKIPRFNLKS